MVNCEAVLGPFGLSWRTGEVSRAVNAAVLAEGGPNTGSDPGPAQPAGFSSTMPEGEPGCCPAAGTCEEADMRAYVSSIGPSGAAAAWGARMVDMGMVGADPCGWGAYDGAPV